MLDERIVKIYIVGNKNLVVQHIKDPGGYLLEKWCLADHRVSDTGQGLYISRYRQLGIYQRFKVVCHLLPIVNSNRNFCDRITTCIASGRFYIYYCKHFY